MHYTLSIFIFRRDLRLEDNTGLINALKSSQSVICAFIFTPEQIVQNPFLSHHCLNFMLESLKELDAELTQRQSRLYLFMGKTEEVLERCIHELKIEAIFTNRDYTPYSQKRDSAIENLCRKKEIAFHSFDDALLHPPESCLKKENTPYTVFTPYFRNARKLEVSLPQKNLYKNYFNGTIGWAKAPSLFDTLKAPWATNQLKGGRKEALKKLKSLPANEQLRDFPAADATSHLSPYLKFTLCSIREAYHTICTTLGPSHELVRALYWRDFFSAIALFFPYVFQGAFRPKFDKLPWSSNEEHFNLWCAGKTGFPLVDAAIRELVETGFITGRARMVAASFLVKDLHIHWQKGEQFFARQLIDYDPAVNNGNWQWAASTGCDAQPYFRIFNPWLQQKKFDPDCLYIKKWIPELRSLTKEAIHQWQQRQITSCAYPPPIIDHQKEAEITLTTYRKIALTK